HPRPLHGARCGDLEQPRPLRDRAPATRLARGGARERGLEDVVRGFLARARYRRLLDAHAHPGARLGRAAAHHHARPLVRRRDLHRHRDAAGVPVNRKPGPGPGLAQVWPRSGPGLARAWPRFQSASRKMRSKSAALQGLGLVWWQMSFTAISTRRGRWSAFTPFSPSFAGMPMRAFSCASHAMKSTPVVPAPQTRASSAILRPAASRLKRITWSIMMPLAS